MGQCRFLLAREHPADNLLHFRVHLDHEQVDEHGGPHPAWVREWHFPAKPPVFMGKDGKTIGIIPTEEEHRQSCVANVKALAEAERARMLAPVEEHHHLQAMGPAATVFAEEGSSW